MPGAKLVGRQQAHKAAMASIDELERRFAQNIDSLVREIDNHIKALTPVNTGSAVRNYIWSRNSPNMTFYKAIDSGPPGPTNSMPLGSEPRRAANEEAAAQSLSTLDVAANPFSVFYLSNVDPDITGLELGILPGPPLKSRSPSGMFGVTAAYVKVMVATQGVLK